MISVPVGVEQVRAGDHVVLPSGQLREVSRVEVYDAHGLEPVESFVVVYSALGAGRAWENRATAKNIASTFTREEGSLVPRRRGELVYIARGPNNPNGKEAHMAVAVAPKKTEPAAEVKLVELLPLDLIDPATDNPRRDVGDVDELAQSIRSIGLLEPLVVTPRGDRYLLVCGARRHAAALLAGETRAPALIREMDETERILAMAIENLQRVDLTPIEEARAYKQLVDDVGMSQRELATRVGRSQGHISKRLTLLQLPEKAIALVDSGGITVAVSLELAKLADDPGTVDELLKNYEAQAKHDAAYALSELEETLEHEVQQGEQRRAIASRRAELEAAGVRVLDWDGFGKPGGPGFIATRIGDGYSELKLNAKKHASEPCHAVGITVSWEGKLKETPFCTDRKRHPEAKTPSEDSRATSRNSSQSRAQQAKQRDLKEAREQRTAFVAELLRKKLPKAELVETIVNGFIERQTHDATVRALRLLDLKPVEKKGHYGIEKDYKQPLRDLAAKGETELLRVGLALAFGFEELELDSLYVENWSGRRKAYVERLETSGYTLTPFEAKRIGRKAPKATRATKKTTPAKAAA